jgi:hypothetical protein
MIVYFPVEGIMDYGEIITRAWNITWKNKFLWVLGFLAALTSIGSNSNSFQYTMDESDFVNNPEMAAQIGVLIFGLMCVFMIIGIVLWLLSVAARGSLIDGVSRIDDGETVTLGEAFSAGTSAIWRLIGVYFLAYLPLIIAGIIMAILAFMTIGSAVAMETLIQNPDEAAGAIAGSMGLLLLCMCLFICIIIPISIVLSFIAEFAARATVIQKMRITESLSQGWTIFKTNLGSVLLLALILFVIGIVISFALGIVMFPLSLIVFAPMITSLFRDGTIGGMNMAWTIGGSLCLGIFGAALMSVVQTWTSAVWTLAYKEFTSKDPDVIPVEKLA